MIQGSPRGPVFIVGSPRSGTSILVDALMAAGYTGFKEGNFLSLIHGIDRQVDRHFAAFGSTNPSVLTTHVDPVKLKADLVAVIAAAAAAHHQGDMWLDKTGNPEMIEAIPTLRRLWPNSVFIFSRRRAIENVASRLKKFPQFTFEYHCRDWAANMQAWTRAHEIDPALPGLDIDQRDIADDPKLTAERLARFLALSGPAEAAIVTTFSTKVTQQTDADSTRRVMTLQSTGWDDEQIATFRRCCGQQMNRYGYTNDETYRRPAPAPAPAPPAPPAPADQGAPATTAAWKQNTPSAPAAPSPG